MLARALFINFFITLGLILNSAHGRQIKWSQNVEDARARYRISYCGRKPINSTKKIEKLKSDFYEVDQQLQKTLANAIYSIPVCQNKINSIVQSSNTILEIANSLPDLPVNKQTGARAKLVLIQTTQSELVYSLFEEQDYVGPKDNILKGQKSSCLIDGAIRTRQTKQLLLDYRERQDELIFALTGVMGYRNYNDLSRELTIQWENKAENKIKGIKSAFKDGAKEGALTIALIGLGGFGLAIKAPSLARKAYTFTRWLALAAASAGATKATVEGYKKGKNQKLYLSLDGLESTLNYVNNMLDVDYDEYELFYTLISDIVEERKKLAWEEILLAHEGYLHLTFKGERVCQD